MPLAGAIRLLARTAAEDVAVVGVAVIARLAGKEVVPLSFGEGGIFVGIRVVGQMFLGCHSCLTVCPAGALGQRVTGCHRCLVRVEESGFLIFRQRGAILISGAYLAGALNGDLRIVLHMTILTAAIDRTLDKGVSVNGDIGLRGQCQRFHILQICVLVGIFLPEITGNHAPGLFRACQAFVGQLALTGTKDMT